MKTHTCIPVLLLLIVAACNTLGDRVANEQLQTTFAPDSLWTPTGNAKLDSLLQLAAAAPQDTNLANLYYQIGYIYTDTDFEKGKEYYQKSGDLSDRLNWNQGRYLYATSFGNVLNREGLSDSALFIFQKGYELAKNKNDKLWVAKIIGKKGHAYFAKDWYEMALSCYFEALPILERINDIVEIQTIYIMIAQIYCNLDKNEKAIEYCEKAIALDSENEYVFIMLHQIYTRVFQYEKAKSYQAEALRLCELHNNTYLIGNIYLTAGVIALYEHDLEMCEKYALKSLEINRKLSELLCCGNLMLLSFLEEMKGDFNKSEAYLKEALQIATEYEELEKKRTCYIMLSELALAQRKYREFINYKIELAKTENVIGKASSIRASEEMNAKYEVAKKELEIERQQSLIARQNLQRWLLAGGVAVCIIILVLLWYLLHLRNRRNLTLSEMNATKDKFFNIISHDLKNPTQALHDNLKLLAHNVRLWDADMLSDFSNELLKSSEGQVELLNSLLSWARIQTGRITCTPVTFDLAARLRTDVALVRKLADNKNITLHAQMPDDATVNGDANMILTVVRNLLTNAVKFTHAGGTVRLDVSPSGGGWDVARNVPTGYIVTISDTGTGMTPEQIENLFRIDKQHTSRGTAGEEGTGLGLIVCKELLGMHGSTLHVESREANGSRFWFEI